MGGILGVNTVGASSSQGAIRGALAEPSRVNNDDPQLQAFLEQQVNALSEAAYEGKFSNEQLASIDEAEKGFKEELERAQEKEETKEAPGALGVAINKISAAQAKAGEKALADVRSALAASKLPSGTLNDIMDKLTKGIVEYKNDFADKTGEGLRRYTAYLTSFTELMTNINSRSSAKDGKTTMNTTAAVGDITKFVDAYRGDKGVMAEFDSEEKAKEYLEHFKAGTVKVSQEGKIGDKDRYVVRIKLEAALTPILQVMIKDGKEGKPTVQQLVGDIVDKGLDASLAIKKLDNSDDYVIFFDGYPSVYFYGNNLPAEWSNALTSAIEDDKKIHNTELQLQIDRYSRVNGQYSELVKAAAGIASDLRDACRAFLSI